MKKIVLVSALIGAMGLLSSCGKSAENKFVGTWQDATDASSSFTINSSDKGLLLQANGESATLAVSAQGDSLNVDGATLTLDEQKQELSMPGLFDSKIIFKKVAGEQK